MNRKNSREMKVIVDVQVEKNVTSTMVVAMVVVKTWWILGVKLRELADALDGGGGEIQKQSRMRY